MTNKECIAILQKEREHSCDLAGADYGWYNCCQRVDYMGHSKDCKKVDAINYAIKILEGK